MLTINSPSEADRFVSKQQSLGNDVRWDNYTMVFFRPDPRGYYSKDGAFRGGQWGFDNRSEVTADGEWHIDWRNVRRGRKVRN